jgi:hypothetical protein
VEIASVPTGQALNDAKATTHDIPKTPKWKKKKYSTKKFYRKGTTR